MVSSEGLTDLGSASLLTHVVIDRIHCVTGCWTESVNSFLVVGQGLPYVLCVVGLIIGKLVSIREYLENMGGGTRERAQNGNLLLVTKS